MTNLAFALERNTIEDLFTENSLPVPAFPKKLNNNLNILEEYYTNIFSTEARALPASFSTLDLYNLDYLFPHTESRDAIKYFACGLHEKSIQNWQFTYLLDSDSIQAAIALPWGNTDSYYNSSKLEMAYSLIEAISTYSHPRLKIRTVLNARQCVWEVLEADGNIVATGTNIQILINILKHHKEI